MKGDGVTIYFIIKTLDINLLLLSVYLLIWCGRKFFYDKRVSINIERENAHSRALLIIGIRRGVLSADYRCT